MRIATTFCATALLLLAGSLRCFAGDDTLTLEADVPQIDIEPQAPGPRIIRLPDLSFTVRIAAHCDTAMQIESAAVSITDTRITVAPVSLADNSVSEQSINIPRDQLAPLTIENFCSVDDLANNNRQMHVADALTAFASLICVGDSQHTISYRAVPLGVALRCRLPGSD